MSVHTCVHCNTPAKVVRVAYNHNGKLYSGVPVWVCLNEECVKKAGGTVVLARSVSKPRAY